MRLFPARAKEGARGRTNPRRLFAAEGVKRVRPSPWIIVQPPPPPGPTASAPGLLPAEAAAAGDARKACVSPDAVSPEPATCPRSFSDTASVDAHPGKERSSYSAPDRRKLRRPEGESPYPTTWERLLIALAFEEDQPGGVMKM
jgi:hypothetical protein